MSEAPTKKTVRAHCPTCGHDRNARVLCEHDERWQSQDESAIGVDHYRVLKCGGCDTVFVQREEIEFEVDGNRTRSFYWPSAVVQPRPQWLDQIFKIDDTLYYLLLEIYEALNNDLIVTPALAMRTAFDRASELLGVDPTLTFEKKLEELERQGRIGADQKATLSALVDAGGAAAHRGWRPSIKQLRTMISIIESFLYQALFVADEAKRLKAAVPARPKRTST
jgi:hypothetical protein